MDKKQLEKRYLDRYVKAYPMFPKGPIQASESPDFIVNPKNKKIGIELCRLYKDSRDDSLSIQAQEDWKKKLVEKAWREFQKVTTERYRVFISFEERSEIQKNNIDILSEFISQKIVEKIETTKPKEGSPVILGRWDLNPYSDIVSMIQVYDFNKYNDYNWSQNNVFTVEFLDIDNLLNTIAKKESLFETYQKCDEMWLILVVDFWNSSMDQAIPANFNVELNDSKFDRILLFKTVEEIVLDIAS